MDITNLGMQAATTGAGMALGWADELIMGNRRRKKQLEQQGKLTQQQVEANKQLARHNKELEFDLWNKTNYGAQVAHMKEAGLNPALMYGQAGQGVTGTAGQSAGGSHASDEAAMQQASTASAGMALQNRLMEVQAKNIEAQTEKTKAETENVGKDTELKGWTIKDIEQGIEVAKTDIALKNSQKELTELQSNSVKIANEFSHENNKELLKQQVILSKKLLVETEIAQKSQEVVLNTLRANLKNSLMDLAYKESNIRLNEANIANLLNSIEVSNKQLIINENTLTQKWNEAVLNNTSGHIGKDAKLIFKIMKEIGEDLGIPTKSIKELEFKELKPVK